MQQTKKEPLCERLVRKGVSRKLALMIETLDEQIRTQGKKIKLEGNSLIICENEKIVARVGELNDERAFVYDSRIFLEERRTAVQVFTSIFLESYIKLMMAVVPIKDCENPWAGIPVPEFHSFRISFDSNGDIVDIALLNDRMETLAFASRICALAEEK